MTLMIETIAEKCSVLNYHHEHELEHAMIQI